MKEKRRRKSRRNIDELEEESGRSISKKRIRTRKEGKGKEWWDAEQENKNRSEECVQKVEKHTGKKGEYIRRRRAFRELCKEKEERRVERLKEEIKNVKTEAQMQKLQTEKRRKGKQ